MAIKAGLALNVNLTPSIALVQLCQQQELLQDLHRASVTEVRHQVIRKAMSQFIVRLLYPGSATYNNPIRHSKNMMTIIAAPDQ